MLVGDLRLHCESQIHLGLTVAIAASVSVPACLISDVALAQAETVRAVAPSMASFAGIPVETLFVLMALAVMILLGLSVFWCTRIRSLERQVNDLDRFSALTTGIRKEAPLGLGIVEEDGKIEINTLISRVLFIEAQRLPWQELQDAFQGEDRSEFADRMEGLIERGEDFEFIGQTAKGKRHLRVYARMVEAVSARGTFKRPVLWFSDETDLIEERDAAAESMMDMRDEAARLSEALGAVPFPVWRRDQTGSLSDANVPAKTIGESGMPSELSERVRRTRKTQSESRHVIIDGARRLIDFTEVPSADGGTLGYATDATVMESMQADLARHMDAQQDVLETLSTAIAIFGPDRRLSFANEAFAKLWGVPKERLLEEPTITELLHLLREFRRLPEQSDFRAFVDQWVRMFGTLIEPQEELMFLPDDSTVRMRVAPHPFGGLIFTFDDVTDRLALERSFNTLSHVQRETIANLDEALIVLGEDGRAKLANPAFQRLWGIPEETIREEPHASELMDHMRPLYPETADWESFKAEVISCMLDRRSRGGRMERSDGTVVDFLEIPLPDGGVLVSFRDVSALMQVQNALQERNFALEAADRLKSEFVASVSYELRTPLNAIVGFAELLEQGYVGPVNERQKEYANAISESSKRLVSLINNILDLASIEAGYLELEWEPVSVESLMSDLQTLVSERARAEGISIEISVEDDADYIVVDERRLTQALFNVLSNAINFTPSGGRVFVTVSREDRDLSIVVSDSGVGMEASFVNRAFEKFERARSGGRSGAGLGLALVKSLIELHGGTVGISSTEGQGTTVTCRIPTDGPHGRGGRTNASPADTPAQTVAETPSPRLAPVPSE